jgi:putative phosphoribosyl transferase
MIRFKDRYDSGKQLAHMLMHYQHNRQAIIIGLPRGGVVTAAAVAHELSLPLDIIVPRKIGAPGQPELAVGALTQEGTIVWNDNLMELLHLTPDDLRATIDEEKREAERRIKIYRDNRPPLNLKNKIVIIIDDGIATGATMRAALASARARGAQKVIVAAPVAATDTLAILKQEADEVVCLASPEPFFGVGAFYDNFAQTTDAQVIQLLRDT